MFMWIPVVQNARELVYYMRKQMRARAAATNEMLDEMLDVPRQLQPIMALH